MRLIKSRKKSASKRKCEKCGASMIPIVYGYPSESLFRDAARGKIALGGCVIMGNDPRWKCSADCHDKKTDEELDL